MDNFIENQTTFFIFLLFIAPHMLLSVKSIQPPLSQIEQVSCGKVPSRKRLLFVGGYCRYYGVPREIQLMIKGLVYDNPVRYRNKKLPKDLSKRDLSGFDFSGCQFTDTNLTEANLDDILLENTTCNYEESFLNNINLNQIKGKEWYRQNIVNDLRSIATVYPKLKNNEYKVLLLRVACGFSRLSFYSDYDEFYIKVQYWSCILLQLKNVLKAPYNKEVICSLAEDIENEASFYCWKTQYPQDHIYIEVKDCHNRLSEYIQDFLDGLMHYQCRSLHSNETAWFQKEIQLNIQSLAEVYPKIKDIQLQKEVCSMAYALSKSYQLQHLNLLNHYIYYQNRLIWLKKKLPVALQASIYFNFIQIV